VNLAWWADPIVFGRYPEDGLEHFKAHPPKITDADLKLISEPIDSLAYDCCSGYKERAGPTAPPR
jgi:beta-glucosidase